jgi:hypothetical protein
MKSVSNVSETLGIQCARRMLSINQRFGKHCSCHIQDECEDDTLKMTVEMFAEALVSTQNSTRLTQTSQNYTFRSLSLTHH